MLTLDIEPMYRVVASVEETAETLQVKGDDEVTVANAVVLENSETPLDIMTLEISVPLPRNQCCGSWHRHCTDCRRAGFHS